MFSDKFIQKSAEYTTFEKFVPAPYFRKTFYLNKKSSPKIIICGLGFYKLFINGTDITKGLFAPYISNPNDLCFYDEYDVTDQVFKGKNVIAVLLGNGFLNNLGGDIWKFDNADFRDAPKFAMSFENDGKVLFEADETFKVADSPIIFDDYRLGEHYDARKEIPGWNEIDFDDSLWKSAIKAKRPLGKAVLSVCEPIKEFDNRKPVEFFKTNDKWIYKFVFNDAGFCRVKIKGEKGQRITLTYGELLKDGDIDLNNIIFKKSGSLVHKDVYILKGEGSEVYSPVFTYHGFQYVSVEGITDIQATDDLLTYVVVHSDIKRAGEFFSSDDTLNRLQDIIVRSDFSNFHYFPTDCPQREKNGWTGDVACSAEQLMCNFNAGKSLAQWLLCLRTAQKANGELPAICPTTGWGYSCGPAWDLALVETTYQIYKYTADKKILEDNIDAILANLRFYYSEINSENLIAFGLGDWVQPGRPAAEPETPNSITDTLTVIHACDETLQILRVIDRKDEISFISAFRNKLKTGFREGFIENGMIKEPFDSQTAIAMAIYYRVFESDEIPSAMTQLVRNIAVKGDHFDTGVLGSKVLYRVLSDNGYADLAYRIITRKTFPSYAYIIDRGATTLWECFVEVEKNKDFSSLNHHFWGDVSAWFYRCLAGINVNPDFLDPFTIEICPKFVSDLKYVRAKVEYMDKPVEVEWRKSERGYEVKVLVAAGFKILTDNKENVNFQIVTL